jgi:hypothetical protein
VNIAPLKDYGHANFSTSAGARNAMAYANPLSPGGLNPKSAHIPTMFWIGLLAVAAFLVYKNGIPKF